MEHKQNRLQKANTPKNKVNQMGSCNPEALQLPTNTSPNELYGFGPPLESEEHGHKEWQELSCNKQGPNNIKLEQSCCCQQIQQKEDEEVEDRYKQLSIKLQIALDKICNDKHRLQTMSARDTANVSDRLWQKKEKYIELKGNNADQNIMGMGNLKTVELKLKTENCYKHKKEISAHPISQKFDKNAETKKKIIDNCDKKKPKAPQQLMKSIDVAKVQPKEQRDVKIPSKEVMLVWKSKPEKEKDDKLKAKTGRTNKANPSKSFLSKTSTKILKCQKRVSAQERLIDRPTTQHSESMVQFKTNQPKVK